MKATPFDYLLAPWNETSGEPVYVLYVDWPSGGQYYAARGWTDGAITVLDRVLQWSGVSTRLMDAQTGGTGQTGLQASVPLISVSLRDDDKTLWLKMRDAQVQGRTARVYLAAYGENPTYFNLFDGTVASQPMWQKGVLSLSLSSAEKTFSEEVGTIATEDILPNVYPDHAGRMLPIVYGSATRVDAIAGAHGSRGKLREDCDFNTSTLYITGFEDKDPSTLITIRIGTEELTGYFKGSRFEVETRGGIVVASGTLANATLISRPGQLYVSTNDLGEVDNKWVGYMIRLSVPRVPGEAQKGWHWVVNMPVGGYGHSRPSNMFGTVYRRIGRYDGTNGYIFVVPSFTYESTLAEDAAAERGIMPGGLVTYAGHVYLPPKNEPYEIVTKPGPHRAGESVWEVLAEQKYIIADHAVKGVRTVYAYGKRADEPGVQDKSSLRYDLGGSIIGTIGRSGYGLGGGDTDSDDISEWIEIPPEHYKVNLNDTTSFPAIGHAVATIELYTPLPLLFGFEFEGVEIKVDMEGKDDGGTMIQNPITVLKDILDNWVSSVPTNAASFTSVAADVDWLKVDFALTERMTAQELITALAWQSRCRALWKDGELFVSFLKNLAPGTHVGFVYGDVVEGSMALAKRAMRSIITELEYKLTIRGEDKVYREEDTAAVTKFGRRGLGEIKDFWAYEREAHAQAVARFWLNRMKSESLIVNVHVPLNHARGEPADWFKVYPGGFLTGETDMEVIGVEHDFGDPAGMSSPKIKLSLIEPYGWESPWECPGADACTGCDIYCEIASDVLPCVTAADIGCSIYDIGGYVTWDLEQRTLEVL